MNIETALEIPPAKGTMELTSPGIGPVADVSVTATRPDEMAQAQTALIHWAEAKVAEMAAEHDEAKATLETAVKCKWRTEPLRRLHAKAEKRLTFYEKILAALRAGYTIVPNFPVTAFAIRTDRTRPLRMLTTSHYTKHTQQPAGLPVGEGEYQNPFPHVDQTTVREYSPPHDGKPAQQEICEYYAYAWRDLEFPVTMAKPEIIEATTRAMAIKVFDDLGVLPGLAPGEGTKPPKGDPMIVARIWDESQMLPGYSRQSRRHVTFMVAWRINTRDI